METLLTFLTFLAWVFAPLASLLLALRIIGAATYSEIAKMADAMRGKRKVFPMMRPFLLAVVAWAWLVVRYAQ